MSKPELIARAEELNTRARELWQESNALTAAEYRARGLDTYRIHPDEVCAAGVPLRAQATSLRAQAKQLISQASGGAPAIIAIVPDLPQPAPRATAPSPNIAPVPPSPPASRDTAESLAAEIARWIPNDRRGVSSPGAVAPTPNKTADATAEILKWLPANRLASASAA